MTSPTTFFLVVGVSCAGVIAACLGAAVYEARRRALRTSKQPPRGALSWPDPYRPINCSRCHAAELLQIPRLSIRCAEVAPEHGVLPVIESDALVCSVCGRVEWFIASPSELPAKKQDG
jgi:hypothetical protein